MSERIASTTAYGPGWIGTEFSSLNHVLIRRDPTPYVVGTGQDVDYELEIPYPHRLQSVQIKHCDGSNADNHTAFTWQFDRLKWKCDGARIWFELWGGAGTLECAEWFTGCTCVAFPQGTYRFRINAAGGHHIFPEVVIQILSKKGPETPHRGLWKSPGGSL